MIKETAVGILALALALMPLASKAQTPELTYEQTRDWIKATMDGPSGGRFQGSSGTINFSYHFISMDACQLIYTETQDWSGRVEGIDAEVITVITNAIPLSKMDSTHSALDGGLYIATLGTSTAAIEARVTESASYKVGDDESVSHVKNAHVEFGQPSTDNHDLAMRFTKAIEHAAGICRTQAPKNNGSF